MQNFVSWSMCIKFCNENNSVQYAENKNIVYMSLIYVTFL